jgi:two-component system alkaline phosphatase synthesis response regulator PhoP
MGNKVLLVEDDKDIVELVRYNLAKAGHQVLVALNGSNGLDKAKRENPDVIILDIMLPDLEGTEICKALRAHPVTTNTPIIFLTAKAEEVDKILGLELGADDYVTKPFSPRELAARVKAQLRRARTIPQPVTGVLTCGKLSIDPERHKVTKDHREVHLSAIEFKLLYFLAANKERVFSRDQLLAHVWGEDRLVTARTVDVHVRRLREKIEEDPDTPQYLTTVRGFGYKLTCSS